MTTNKHNVGILKGKGMIARPERPLKTEYDEFLAGRLYDDFFRPSRRDDVERHWIEWNLSREQFEFLVDRLTVAPRSIVRTKMLNWLKEEALVWHRDDKS